MCAIPRVLRRSDPSPFPERLPGSGLRAGRGEQPYAVQWCWEVIIQLWVKRLLGLLTLPLLVAGIGADHHDPPMPADHPALVADGL